MGAVSSIIFAKRNIDKTANGDIGRAPIPVFQALSATAGVATLAKSAGFTKLDKGMTSVFSATDKVIEKSSATKKIQLVIPSNASLEYENIFIKQAREYGLEIITKEIRKNLLNR
jgi:hypothetical protein